MKKNNKFSFVFGVLVATALALPLIGCGEAVKSSWCADILGPYTSGFYCVVDDNNFVEFKPQDDQVNSADFGYTFQGRQSSCCWVTENR